MEPVAVVFGRRVRTLRAANGLTQEELGRAAGIDYKHLSAVERGAKTPSFDAIGKLAKALGVEYWELFIPAPQRRISAAVEREINAAMEAADRIERANVEDFLRTLKAAVRKLDRRGPA